MKRRRARENLFKALFMIEIGENDPGDVENYLLQGSAEKAQETDYFRSSLQGILRYRGELDRILKEHLINWKLDRLSPVVRNILRIGLYEIMYIGEIPEKVSINEAIELAKIYQDEEASRFVNGVLDRIRKDVEGES